MKYPIIPPRQLSGDEAFQTASGQTAATVLDFWRWAFGDLMSNASRGVLAEFIVATALETTSHLRQEWAPFDLIYQNGIRVEVKAAGYIQGWGHDRLAVPKFSIRKAQYYDRSKGQYQPPKARHSEVYVFCLHKCKDPKLVDPLDLSQWCFYVVPTKEMDELWRERKDISAKQLEAGGYRPVNYEQLKYTVDRVAKSSA
jgi:hypothetical protein